MTGSDRLAHDPSARPAWPLWLAAALLLASLLAFWPGVAMYDTVRQYGQALSGHYDDWHPPVMARLWSLLHPLGEGTGPMFLLQITGYWLGLGLFARALGGIRAFVLLLVAASPLLLGWQIVILKDGQMVAALACAVGLVASRRLRGLPIPWPDSIAIALCLAYALLLRSNAAFTVVPLAAILFLPTRDWRLRAAAILAAIPLALFATQYASRHVFMAQDSGFSRAEAVYDLSAIAVATGETQPGGAPPIDVDTLAKGHCVKPLFWDPLFGRDDCVQAVVALNQAPASQLYAALVRAALAHPLVFAGHRLGHLNATLRWVVPAHWPLADPPAANEPNHLGLDTEPGPALLDWQHIAGKMVDAPLGWPVVWLVLGLWALDHARTTRANHRRTIAFALLASALCQEASFAVLSISSDLRYHLWPMLAVALAWLLLPPPINRRAIAPLIGLALVLAIGFHARATLPPTPVDYGDLLN